MIKTALISGCFDGLHVGHRYILAEIRKLAPYTIVTLNSDAYLRRKGPGRPLNAFEARRAALYESGLVNEVIAIEDSPLETIKLLRPDLICVGRNDYTLDQIVGSKECPAWGGQVVIISPDMGVTTTQLVKAKLTQSP